MPSSAHSDAVGAAARRLLNCEPTTVVPIRGGGNNRLYRIEDGNGHPFALKSYPRLADDPRDRLDTEFTALSFLAPHGLAVPKALAAWPEGGFALYSWIEGAAPGAVRPNDINAAIAFAANLHRLAERPESKMLPLASEACLSAEEILRQIKGRQTRLAESAALFPALSAFLSDDFRPTLNQATQRARQGYDRQGWSFDAPIPHRCRTLSPSDFGFHNAIRRPDGSLAFVDFEYFGWDDPVRLAADFLQHPAMVLTAEQATQWRRGIAALYGADHAFQHRLSLLYSLVGLRWCMILLNEFLPDRWLRRQFAGAEATAAETQARQLIKAQARLTAVRAALNQD
ncbi:MAG: hypothetical protein Q7R40_10770 [Phaeospirillum sp.]|nr:hypothetical protein [Phaeospirillum sp.]